MKKQKTQRGITLVALIITIVVLLILAAVAIGTAKDSDITGYAQNAAGSFNEAKANELDMLTEYEELMKGPIEYKVYGTEDFYVIISSENDIIAVQDSEIQINTKMIKKDKEEYLSGLSSEEATAMREEIEKAETQCGASAEYIIFIEGMNNGYPLGGAVGNKLFFYNSVLELNTELAKSVVRKEGTYQCFGEITDNGDAIIWDVNYNDNTCSMIWDLSSSGNAKRFKYQKNSITQNEQTITIYVEGEKVVIGPDAMKVETQFEGDDNSILVYYIQDSNLYMDDEQSSIEDGDTDGMAISLVDYDLSKFGIIVVE